MSFYEKKTFKNQVKIDWLSFDVNDVKSMQGQNLN
jgi:hypothetical protein